MNSFILLINIVVVESIRIKLDYYSNTNLPFGLESTINGNFTHSDGSTLTQFKKNMNLTINTNTPFTILFDMGIEDLKSDNHIKLQFYQEDYTFKGSWADIKFDVPVIDDGQVVNYTMPVRAFLTNDQSIHKGQSFLGVLPGPKSLENYLFFL